MSLSRSTVKTDLSRIRARNIVRQFSNFDRFCSQNLQTIFPNCFNFRGRSSRTPTGALPLDRTGEILAPDSLRLLTPPEMQICAATGDLITAILSNELDKSGKVSMYRSSTGIWTKVYRKETVITLKQIVFVRSIWLYFRLVRS